MGLAVEVVIPGVLLNPVNVKKMVFVYYGVLMARHSRVHVEQQIMGKIAVVWDFVNKIIANYFINYYPSYI